MEKNKKKGVSDIIATVLILLLTVSGASILLVVIYNFTTDNLTPDKTTCFEIQNKLKIISSESCYTDSPSKSTTIRVRTEADLKEFNLYLEDDSDMKVFIMKKGEVVVNARNINKAFTDPIEFPAINGEKIYFFKDISANKVKIAAVINKETCSISQPVAINKCS
ncbi:MAG TPA: hypothetical protein P5277_02430 [Candidatus Paceibacterota bacterium]|nr:hypothetical protein [Candidatus Paceibacterota bacterium]